MSEEPGFTPTPFRPDEALLRLRRELRDMGLAEREGAFQRRGVAIARVAIDGGHLAAAIVRRPARSSPEWLARSLRSNAEVRDFATELKNKLAQWSDRDD
jgi:hypothetical protein